MRPIKVKELIEKLKNYDDEDYVGLSEEGEDNGFSLIADDGLIVENLYMKPELGFQETFYTPEVFKGEKGGCVEDCYGNKVKFKSLRRCIIIFGSNYKA